MRSTIRFIRRGRLIELVDVPPTMMLLDYLRETEGATGTKEGCREGDCGACTVAIGRLRNGALLYEPVNACILLLGQVDGTEVITVEDLAQADGALHPVQAAMVEKHASQCGFCTPGFVMSLFTLYQSTVGPVSRDDVNACIAGNLCRCTGYRPIVDAGIAACAGPRQDRFVDRHADVTSVLQYLADDDDVLVGDDNAFFAAPGRIATLVVLYEKHPDATLVGGATDVGLWITKGMRDLRKIIYTGNVRDFDRIEDTGNGVVIGGGATLAQATPHLSGIDPDLGGLLRRFGGAQVRARGTVAGNIANGSPIGDLPPALIALGATVELRKGRTQRTMQLEDFFVDYGKQARVPGEVVTSISVPRLGDHDVFRCFKVAKRFDSDISAVMGAFRLTIEDDAIREARLAFGGMAAVPKRARKAEEALEGQQLRDARAWASAFAALREDFAPIGDHRASARYRTETAHALLGKALIEAAGTTSARTRIAGLRETVAHGSAQA
jgi:xanthine dehydrogenase small subunit